MGFFKFYIIIACQTSDDTIEKYFEVPYTKGYDEAWKSAVNKAYDILITNPRCDNYWYIKSIENRP